MKKKAIGRQIGESNLVTIACTNAAGTDLGVSFAKLTAALQTCFDKYFLPVWGVPVKLYNTNAARHPWYSVGRPSDWGLVYFDDIDCAKSEGYHGLSSGRKPIAPIFVRPTLASGNLVSVAACHALFETIIDPYANLWAEVSDGTEFAYEVCDPVEEDTFVVEGIAMSNFLYPSWFEPTNHSSKTKFDHLGLLKKPFTMSSGGYVIIKKNGRVIEQFGSTAKKARFAKEDRRGHRSEFRRPRFSGYRR